MIHELHELLGRAGARLRSLRLMTCLALCWLFWAAVVWTVAQFATPDGRHWQSVWLVLAAATATTAIACIAAVRRVGRDPRAMARRIEATHPELGAMLLAALETAPVPRFKRLGYLQTAVVRGAVSHGRQHDWANATSPWRLRMAKTAHLASLAALASACLLLVDRTTARGNAGNRSRADEEAILGADYKYEIQPGNAEIERGTTLLVIAKFRGAVPPDAEMVVHDESAKDGRDDGVKPQAAAAKRTVRGMTRSLDDPQFVGRVPVVAGPLSYRVEFAGQRTPTYHITVFEYPELVRADARMAYPEYTRLEPKVVEDVRQVTAVEGTKLTLQFRLNKNVESARLVDRDGEEVTLTRVEGADPVYEVSYTLARSQRFKLHLIDANKRKNKLPPEIVVNVTPNNPAEIKIAKPGKDVRVSPLEELQVSASVTDDFGVTSYGLGYSLGGDEPLEIAEMSQTIPAMKESLSHLIDFESLKANPDQLVSYYVWAEDIGPDGKPRRTLSDMYFAEVRQFEEIFREGEQPTEQQQREQQQQQGQQSGAAQQAEELAELEKQVVNATWTLIRRETGDKPTEEFATDATAVVEGQQQAIDKLGELGEQVTDGQSTEYLADAERQMKMALDAITRAAGDGDSQALRPALSAEQAAYQALLKLRAREFNVTRSNQGQQSGASASGANSASQQQLQQLELSADENRYETQSRAEAANKENAEQLQQSREVLNRLSELARRQQDLNERLRELQSSLDAAETPEEKAEIERQLKRLRDQQREILRDAEALDNDMQTSENREQMQQAAEQLGQTRSRVQDASQALEEGQVSQALTEGTRAERELSELRDDFRKQTADRFTEEMKNLRDAAERLDERQEQLGEQLDEMNTTGRRSLRDTGPREEFLQGMQEQQGELEETLDTMRETVTEAEEPEPLLARQLYDAVQDAAQQRTAEALDVARQLTEAGVSTEAGEAMRQAGRGVDRLREQIDRAAESVLGDETEALRRADERLAQLGEQLNREIDQARGESRETQESREERGGQSSDSEDSQLPGEQADQRAGEPGDQPGQREGQSEGQSERSEQTGEGEREREGQRGQGSPSEQRGQGGEPSETGQPGQQSQGEQGEGQRGEARQAQGEQAQRGEGQQGQQGQRGQGQQDEGQQGQPGQGGQEERKPSQGEQGQGGQGQQQGEQGQEGQGQGGQPGEATPGAADGEGQQAQPGEGGQQPQDGNRNGSGQRDENRNNGGGSGGALDQLGQFQDAFNGAERDAGGPITGEDFRQWSEGMREVEDMLDDPELASEAARIRDRAEQARVDYVRRSKTPDWNKMVEMVADPLVELRAKIAEEIRRKESPDALAPIERDAAPAEYAEEVRLYYQRLGSGE